MPSHKAKWTVLTYIAAHNNLFDSGLSSWQQILNVGSTREVMQGVLFDGPLGASRYIFGDPGKEICKEDFETFDSGDPERLVETALWLFQQYPADKYGLVLWSHGTGWQPEEIQKIARQTRGDEDVSAVEVVQRSISSSSPALFRTSISQIVARPSYQRAILFDDGSQHSLDTLELHNVLNEINEKTGSPLELLGMDACLMGSIEVAYQVRQQARWMVASQELVPAESWPYEAIYGALKANPDFTGADLAQTITREYKAYYQEVDLKQLGADVTKSALDLSQVETVSRTLKEMGDMLSADIETLAEVLWKAQIESRERELNGRRPSKFDMHLWDIKSLVGSLTEQSLGDALKAACREVSQSLQPGGAVLDKVHLGSWFDGTGGVSVYLPMPSEVPRATQFYPELHFARDTGWDHLLSVYHQEARKRRMLIR
jgi:hypothetical protein